MADPSQFDTGVQFAELTDIGMRRTNNQDSIVCVPARSPAAVRSRGHLFVVADGMGAHAAGELASRIATAQIAQHYVQLSDSHSIASAVHGSMAQANLDIYNRGQSNPEFLNMGTTACALVLSPRGAIVGHVGDSRVYRLRDQTLEQLTFDHSLVWELEASGQVTGAGAANIPKNVITRSLGPQSDVQIDIEGPLDVLPGDRFLLCSDGLTGPVTDEEIAVLLHTLDADLATRVLVDLANLRGGPDNISVVVVHVQPGFAEHVCETASDRSMGSPRRWLFAAAAALFAAAVVSWWFAPIEIVAGLFVLAIVAATAGAVLPADAKAVDHDARPAGGGGGEAPYRRYPVRATASMVQSLGKTIDQLCEAATGRGWSLNQTDIQTLRKDCRAAVGRSDWQRAIELQAEAILETMNQLRRQNDAAAAETAAR